MSILAMINGYCFGGGLQLAMACDIRIASDRATIGQTEINIGIIPGGGGSQRLPRLVGIGNALKLTLTGERIDANEAWRMGFFFQAEDGIRDLTVTGVQTCALPI